MGPYIFVVNQQNTKAVRVNMVYYYHTNPLYSGAECLPNGKPCIARMTNNITEFDRRNELILEIMKRCAEPEIAHMLTLSDRREHLRYLHDAITERNIGSSSVGYYVGGMKQASLQETEEKQIVLATYAMAAAALDIKTLATLVMVTPKTDITQSVGRILRIKHENPIIVDIIDSHDIFQNQWTQRKRFYKKCNYRIRQIDSSKYSGMDFDWETDQTWKRVFEAKNSINTKKDEHSSSDDDHQDKKNVKCLIDTSMFTDI
jgi:hypothetical protein